MRRFGSSLTALTLAGLLLMPAAVLPALADSDPQLNFKIYNPDSNQSSGSSFLGPIDENGENETSTNDEPEAVSTPSASTLLKEETPQLDESTPAVETADTAEATDTTADSADGQKTAKRLQGYVRVVPTGTKIPIIMDTAVDSDT
ncbi:MAG: hypothetical protein K8F91_03705, partial [Candidatus Obscuribacterales bacterium]|nr:hypothetical protein [Candidatus Obscuribacterales bacterium]